MNNKAKTRRRLIALGITAVVVLGIIIGVTQYIAYQNDQKTVPVQPMSYVANTYWGDQTSCQGNIVSDYVQELYPDSSKNISEIFVTEGQQVSVGDPLLQYDRTSLELDMDAKEIALQQAQVRIDEAQRQLKKYQNSKPISTSSGSSGGTTIVVRPTKKPTTTPKPTTKPTTRPTATPKPTATPVPTVTPIPTLDPDVVLHTELTPQSVPYKGTGTTEDPYVFLCKDGFTMTPEFLKLLFGLYPTATPEPTAQPTPDPATPEPDATPEGPAGEPESQAEDQGSPDENPDPDAPGPTADPMPDTNLRTPFAAVLEVREGDSNHGKVLSSITLDGNSLSGALTLPGLLQAAKTAETVMSQAVDSEPEFKGAATPTPKPTATPSPNNYDGQYTRAELNALIKQTKQEITGLQHNLKQAQLDLDKAKRALENSTVTSTIDGQVHTLIDIDTALAESRPFLVVSGAQQYYVNGTISETLLGSIATGDEVTVNSWMNGMTYTAQIVSISDYPTENGYFYGGNPNSSNYEFTAVVLDPDDTIQTGTYVDITMNLTDTSPSDAFYLDKMYIREDDYGYYVMKAGKDNRLIQEHITVGKSIWGGQALEIKTGLTMEDFVAFPYGPDVKEGVRVVLKDTGEPPWPEEDAGSESSGLPEGSESLPEGEDPALSEDGGDASSDGDLPADDGAAALPEGGVITGRTEDGITFETENGGGIILD